MSRPLFIALAIVVVLVILCAMWLGWRARTRRDNDMLVAQPQPVGELVAEFTNQFYVSTTPIGDPLTRVAIPGLRYRGFADIRVHTDGVSIEVRGEHPVHLGSTMLLGSGTASRRVGKAVESDGLALLQWQVGEHALESSFRFGTLADQQRFLQIIDQISPTQSMSQEGTQ